MFNLPDNVILLDYVSIDKGDDYHIEHIGNFIKFLMKIGDAYQIQHLAIALYYCWCDDEDFIKVVGRKGFVPYTLCLCKIGKSNLSTFEI